MSINMFLKKKITARVSCVNPRGGTPCVHTYTHDVIPTRVYVIIYLNILGIVVLGGEKNNRFRGPHKKS